MDLRGIVMETIIASVITGIFGIIVVLITNASINKKGYDKIDSKIGELGDDTLSRQHRDIKENIRLVETNIKESIIDKTSSVYSKVDNINEMMIKNEGRYENLNLDQREIRNNIDKLLFEWQSLLTENNKLRMENNRLRDKIHSLQNQIEKEDEFENEL